MSLVIAARKDVGAVVRMRRLAVCRRWRIAVLFEFDKVFGIRLPVVVRDENGRIPDVVDRRVVERVRGRVALSRRKRALDSESIFAHHNARQEY